ncbi:anti-repressor SinI family protein [Salipaludibacillus sp. CUR1]|nr:anti-repressor SinI family protein [Salipaludibacillus sp. CUR1]MCE7792195.1 anti-repressor SinI family protein [Salipaludibacillus sp. CUR1]
MLKVNEPLIEEEWVQLINRAREMGLSPEEIRAFLKENTKQN